MRNQWDVLFIFSVMNGTKIFISGGKAANGGQNRNEFKNCSSWPESRWGVTFWENAFLQGFTIAFFICKTEAKRNLRVLKGFRSSFCKKQGMALTFFENYSKGSFLDGFNFSDSLWKIPWCQTEQAYSKYGQTKEV